MSDTPLVTATVTPAPLPESFTLADAAALAHDVAVGMYEETIILKKHGNLTPGQYETLKAKEFFQKLVEDYTIGWNAPTNAQQRLANQAAVGLETVLPDVIMRAKVRNEPLQAIAQLLKVVGDIAGVGANKPQAPPSEKFTITINLGADTEVYEKTKPVITVESAPEIQPVSEGISALLALQPEPEKT